MNVTISARHFDLTDAIKEAIQSEIDTIHHDQIVESVEVVLDQNSKSQNVEVIVTGKHLHVISKDTSGDMYTSITSAFKGAQRQIDKQFGMLTDHKETSVSSNEQLLQG